MEPTLLALFALAAFIVPAAFIAGVIFHKYVVSEAEALRAHTVEVVSGAETRIRADVASLLKKASGEVSIVESGIEKHLK
jgi:hypothetical protein